MDGGIFGLLGLIRAHRGAVEYDLRTRCNGLTLRDVSTGVVTLHELVRIVTILRADPSSAIASALMGWEFPISREALIALDTYDLLVAANSDPTKGTPKPHPGRPFEMKRGDVRKHGNTSHLTRDEVVAILNAHGHNLPV